MCKLIGRAPPRLPYMDCLQVAPYQFQLSWSWPTPNVRVTGAVVEVRDEAGLWSRDGTTDGVKYSFKGKDSKIMIISKQIIVASDF